ncbi:MAG: flagellar basal body P-ring protein FlgI, partial [Planctomycetota bacterium]
TMEIPPTGAREGDRLDVHVGTLFNATSLEGGMLVVSPLRLPLPDAPELLPMAVARGTVVIEGASPRTGIVRGGGQMISDASMPGIRSPAPSPPPSTTSSRWTNWAGSPWWRTPRTSRCWCRWRTAPTRPPSLPRS